MIRPRVSLRWKLAASYAFFLLAAGVIVLTAVYVVLRYVPDYPLTIAGGSNDGQPAASRSEILHVLLQLSMMALAILAVIGIVGGWLLAGWMLRPLDQIAQATRIAATGDLSHRIAMTKRRDEFGELAASFDDMTARLKDAFDVQERLSANAAHELRTPLAVNATLLEVALAYPDEAQARQTLERLQIMNYRAIDLTEALLRLADANAVTMQAKRLDLAALASECLREAEPDLRAAGLQVNETSEPAWVNADTDLLRQLITNLLGNAARHGAPGPLDLRVRPTPVGVELTMANPGPVFTAQSADELREPFLRGRGRTSGDGRSHGLGLALVDRICQVHQGSLNLRPRPGGGLIVTIRLPA